MTLFVCSSCHAPLPEGRTHCARCGPGSLAVLPGDGISIRAPDDGEAGAARLERALGGRHRVLRLIGRGGFAEVYEVVDTDLQRRLAVKVLRADLPWGPGTRTRFQQEARAIARLNHPNTVPIHFVGDGEGLVFYAMPYLEGRSLAEVLRTDGPLSVERALGVVEPILDALQHAHEHGLVHRDVKPDNILIEAGTARPLLVDFGIVKYLDGPSHQTESGFIVGTPLYMSPEQALGSRVDARTDIYGLGAVLYQLLTGAPPFEGNDSQEIVGRHLREPVPVAPLSRDGVPPWLSRIVVRCMAKRPDDRYPTARALRDALRAGRADAGRVLPDADTPTQAMPQARPSSRRRRPWLAAGLAGAALVATAAVALAGRAGPSLVVENRLAQPIALTLGDSGYSVAAGDSVRIPLARDEPVEAHWAVVQPPVFQGRPFGAAVEGAIVADRATGELREIVDAENQGDPWFVPVVVNRTGRTLGAAIVSGTDSIDCGCRIPPGDSVPLGYYPLEASSAVRLGDGGRGTARLGGLAEVRDPVSGVVLLRIDSAALAAPAVPAPAPPRAGRQQGRRPAPSARPAPRNEPPRNPLGGFLPVR